MIETRKALSSRNSPPVAIKEGSSTNQNIEPFERHYYKNNLNKPSKTAIDENEKVNNFLPIKETIIKKVEFPIEIERRSSPEKINTNKSIKYSQGAGRSPLKTGKVLDNFEYNESEEENLKFLENPKENWDSSSSIQPKSKLMKSILNKSKISNTSNSMIKESPPKSITIKGCI